MVLVYIDLMASILEYTTPSFARLSEKMHDDLREQNRFHCFLSGNVVDIRA